MHVHPVRRKKSFGTFNSNANKIIQLKSCCKINFFDKMTHIKFTKVSINRQFKDFQTFSFSKNLRFLALH